MKTTRQQKHSRNHRADFLLERRIAHRGLHNVQQGIPENSLLAFAMAVKHGYAIELDVHLTRDGQVVVMHDNSLERMTGTRGKITHRTYAELKKLKLSGTDQKVPLLEEVLQLVAGRVPVVVELKNYKFWSTRLERATVKILQHYTGAYAMKSFNPVAVRYLQKHHPEIVRGQLASDFRHIKIHGLKRWLLKSILTDSIKITKPDFVSCSVVFCRIKELGNSERGVQCWDGQ